MIDCENFKLRLPDRCIWVTVEGADKVGKTTLCDQLAPILRSRLVNSFDVISIPEVSDYHTGRAIIAGYQDSRFHLQHDKFDSQIGDALLWMSDQFNSLQEAIARTRGPSVFLSDRGPDSRRIIQETKLESAYPELNSGGISAWVGSILSPLPDPTLTMSITTAFEKTIPRMRAPIDYVKYMRRVKEKFDQLPYLPNRRIVELDGNKSVSDVLNVASKVLFELLHIA